MEAPVGAKSQVRRAGLSVTYDPRATPDRWATTILERASGRSRPRQVLLVHPRRRRRDVSPPRHHRAERQERPHAPPRTPAPLRSTSSRNDRFRAERDGRSKRGRPPTDRSVPRPRDAGRRLVRPRDANRRLVPLEALSPRPRRWARRRRARSRRRRRCPRRSLPQPVVASASVEAPADHGVVVVVVPRV